MVRLILLKHVKNHFAGPLQLSNRLLFTKIIAINHHARLRCVAEMIFQQVRAGERFMEILTEPLRRKQPRQFIEGKDLGRSDRKHEPIIVRGGHGIAAAQTTQAQREHASEGVIRRAANQAVKKIMARGSRQPPVTGLLRTLARGGGKRPLNLDRLRKKVLYKEEIGCWD